MSRCVACNITIDFGQECCHDCETAIWEYNIDLHIPEDEDVEFDVPPSGDDWDRDEV